MAAASVSISEEKYKLYPSSGAVYDGMIKAETEYINQELLLKVELKKVAPGPDEQSMGIYNKLKAELSLIKVKIRNSRRMKRVIGDIYKSIPDTSIEDPNETEGTLLLALIRHREPAMRCYIWDRTSRYIDRTGSLNMLKDTLYPGMPASSRVALLEEISRCQREINELHENKAEHRAYNAALEVYYDVFEKLTYA